MIVIKVRSNWHHRWVVAGGGAIGARGHGWNGAGTAANTPISGLSFGGAAKIGTATISKQHFTVTSSAGRAGKSSSR